MPMGFTIVLLCHRNGIAAAVLWSCHASAVQVPWPCHGNALGIPWQFHGIAETGHGIDMMISRHCHVNAVAMCDGYAMTLPLQFHVAMPWHGYVLDMASP